MNSIIQYSSRDILWTYWGHILRQLYTIRPFIIRFIKDLSRIQGTKWRLVSYRKIAFCSIYIGFSIGFSNLAKSVINLFIKLNMSVYQGTTFESMINHDKNLSLNLTNLSLFNLTCWLIWYVFWGQIVYNYQKYC